MTVAIIKLVTKNIKRNYAGDLEPSRRSATKHTRHKAGHFMCYRTRVPSLAETSRAYLQNKVVVILSVLTFLVTFWLTEKLLTREESFCSTELNNIYQVMSWYFINYRSSVLKTYSPRNFDISRRRLSRSYVRDLNRVPFNEKCLSYSL